MSDLSLEWPADGTTQGDLGISTDGDLLVADGDTEARQRATRRLLTNPRVVNADGSIVPCDNLFDPAYGVGLRRWVGAAANARATESIKQQCVDGLLLEDVISQNPAPVVQVQAVTQGLAVVAKFQSAITGKPVSTPRINLT